MTIVNRDHSFIYLKTHKTASSSTELYFITCSPLGDDSYATSKDASAFGVPMRKNNVYFRLLSSRRRFQTNENLLEKAVNFSGRHLPPVKNLVGCSRLGEHQSGDDVRVTVGSELFDSCHVVTSIRNPWDALVSSFRWRTSGKNGTAPKLHATFREFLNEQLSSSKEKENVSVAEYYHFSRHIEGESWSPTSYLYYEDLDASIDSLSRDIGLHLPRFSNQDIWAKKTNDSSDDYRAYYTDDTAEWVFESFRSFLKRFPYQFDRPSALPCGAIKL